MTKDADWLSGARLAAFYMALAVLTLAPLVAVHVPLLGDLPNHLARLHILERLGSESPLASFYTRQHRIVPYQAMDVVVGAMRPWLSLYEAGRVFLAICLLVPPAAAAALRYAVTGRVGLLPAASFLLSYNYLLARGLLDYLFAMGLAVLLFSLWLRLASWGRWRRTALCGAGLTLVYLGHLYGGLVYCILVAGDVVAVAVRARFRPFGAVVLDAAAAAAQTLPCLVLALAFGANGAFGGSAVTHYGSLAAKIGAALTPVFFPAPAPVLALFGLLPVAGLLLCVALRGRIAPRLRGPAIAVAIAAAAAPNVLFNAWATDMRLPIVLAIVLIAGVLPARRTGITARTAAALGLVALLTVRAGSALALLHTLDQQAAQLRGLLLALPPGARLLVVDDGDPTAPLRAAPHEITDHMALLATLERDAFVPYVLTGATQIVTNPRMERLSSPNGAPIRMDQLRDAAARNDPPGALLPYGHGGHIYWLGWPTKFDDVLVMHFGAPTGKLPPALHEVASVPIATLFAVRKAVPPIGIETAPP